MPSIVAVGGIYSPNHQNSRWGGLLSMGTPDSLMCHRTVRCATRHCPVRQPRHPTVRVLTVSTVGALTSCRTGQSGATPDSYCSVSGAPLTPALTSACTVHAFANDCCAVSRCSAGTPDSLVAHRTVW
jgi:hypothetical protein